MVVKLTLVQLHMGEDKVELRWRRRPLTGLASRVQYSIAPSGLGLLEASYPKTGQVNITISEEAPGL